MILFPNFLARSVAMAENGDKEPRQEEDAAQYIKTPGHLIISDLEHGNNHGLGGP